MQVTSLLSRQENAEHDHCCGDCGHEHEHEHEHSHAVLPLAQTLIGLLFVINSFAVNWMSGFFQGAAEPVSAASVPRCQNPDFWKMQTMVSPSSQA